jgi:hypothetical protein
MPQYKDIDAILNRLPNDLPYKASVKRVLIQAPEADVVPKSELDRVYHNLRAVLEERAETRAEIAREIFEEIEEVFRQHVEGGYYLNCVWFPERLDLYTQDAIAELKKKYTEVENA